MIYANINNRNYDFESPLFKIAYAFLTEKDLLQLPVGRIDLENGIYANVQEYETKPENECIFETHKKYFDIQYVVSGIECISICDLKDLTVLTPYNEEKDITFYSDPKKYSKVILSCGDYVIVSPDEAHKPKCMVDTPSKVKKIVVKVPV